MTKVFIGIGSNIEPEVHIPMALERLKQQLNVISTSSFYRIPAMGTALGQADFINGMIEVETQLSARQLKYSILREIEYELGRNKETSKHAARSMDLDLILFGDEVISSLNVPEPMIKERPYVYLPLLEIAPDIVLPGEFEGLGKQLGNELLSFDRTQIEV